MSKTFTVILKSHHKLWKENFSLISYTCQGIFLNISDNEKESLSVQLIDMPICNYQRTKKKGLFRVTGLTGKY